MPYYCGNSLNGYAPNSNSLGSVGYMMSSYGPIFMVLFWGIVIIGLIFLISYIFKSGDQKNSSTALDILKQRYASDEISKKEFLAKKKELDL
jgi:uncharacterized membrane protein